MSNTTEFTDVNCECEVTHPCIVERIQSQMPTEDETNNLSSFFKVLGDSTRLKIVMALCKEEICSCDIASILNMSNSAVSHQLRILKQMKIVKYRKSGKFVYYSLDDAHIKEILTIGLEHMNE